MAEKEIKQVKEKSAKKVKETKPKAEKKKIERPAKVEKKAQRPAQTEKTVKKESKDKTKKTEEPKIKKKTSETQTEKKNLKSKTKVIHLRPLITEKAVMMIEAQNVLTFETSMKEDKQRIKSEVEEIFNVKVENVRTLIRNGKKYAYVKLNPKDLAIDIATKLGMI